MKEAAGWLQPCWMEKVSLIVESTVYGNSLAFLNFPDRWRLVPLYRTEPSCLTDLTLSDLTLAYSFHVEQESG